MDLSVKTPPSSTFWRFILTLSAGLAFLSAWEMLGVARRLEVRIETSKTWLGLIFGLGLIGLLSLTGILLTFWPPRRLRFVFQPSGWLRYLAFPALIFLLLAYPFLIAHPFYGALIVRTTAMRTFLFWAIALSGAFALLLLRKDLSWPLALGIVLLGQAFVHLVISHLASITAYPFALGWSETSRYYYPALFLAQKVFGQSYPWPILHPSLHLTLAPPYLFAAPLWFHRAWQVGMRFLLLGLIPPALLSRLNIQGRGLRWLSGLWVFLYLLDLPLYLHLAVPVFLMLWGFSVDRPTRTWAALLAASIWAGLSRLNWYPLPGMLAAGLYLLEVPYENKGWRYLLKPAVWFVTGSAVAFLSMRVYIAFSGIPSPGAFYTSLTSSLLWYRLWPNESFPLGVLPGIILFSLPLWLVVGWLGNWRRQMHPLRLSLLGAELVVLFLGGIVVSMKIGGGADLHNMDAYAVFLLILGMYVFYHRFQPEKTGQLQPVKIHWLLVGLLFIIPAWFGQRASVNFVTYDKTSAQSTLSRLQTWVDQANAEGGEILFITQRHLISMHMLENVTLVPEYEREELMEMAMANNKSYLSRFATDIEHHRFSAIIVDPLRFTQVGWREAMGAENNAWARRVVKPILCYYEQAEAFPADRIVIYVPRAGAAQCP
ncbi:MAG: hypothetical protein ACUVRJ_10890 [Candidatus Villigracilaceae bacterium]